MAENKGVLDDMNAEAVQARSYILSSDWTILRLYILPFFQMHTPAAGAVDIIPGQ